MKMKCVVCGLECIAMCPRCHAAVHHRYGQNGDSNCSGIHGQDCKELAVPKEVQAKEVGPEKIETGKK